MCNPFPRGKLPNNLENTVCKCLKNNNLQNFVKLNFREKCMKSYRDLRVDFKGSYQHL